MKAAEFHQARKFADTTFGRIAYVEKGAGPVALFIHGFPVNGFAWRDVLDDLAPARRCIALDLMGLGYTEIKADQDLGFDQQAAMIAAFMDRLGLSQVDLVGNDSGASISQVFAARYPSRLRSLTLTNCEVHDLWPNAMLKAAFDQFADPSIIIGMKTMLDAPAVARQAFASVYEDAERIPDEAFKMYFEAALASEDRSNNLRRFLSLGNLKVLTAIAPQLRELKVPTLIVWGEADTAFDLKSVDWLKNNIGNVRRVIMVPRAKLFFPEEHPKLMSVLLQEFWRSIA
ncbi:alpha/beta fold hydrolase [Candidatus Binatus sp.]|jgi:haloalkane dehalogenase|uniref:alpha/beta fold hydrolase n=1 Tax=Candidatus Binatus sp. TaxID=2811406 RepID=UPI003CB0B6E3